ncbi:hypothetical protein DFH09DRAFT_1082667 [Mycena vulgaris]|nr:hypothetical protein DFH09DRAFT_1082667 [Mycena vulgaris]
MKYISVLLLCLATTTYAMPAPGHGGYNRVELPPTGGNEGVQARGRAGYNIVEVPSDAPNGRRLDGAYGIQARGVVDTTSGKSRRSPVQWRLPRRAATEDTTESPRVIS